MSKINVPAGALFFHNVTKLSLHSWANFNHCYEVWGGDCGGGDALTLAITSTFAFIQKKKSAMSRFSLSHGPIRDNNFHIYFGSSNVAFGCDGDDIILCDCSICSFTHRAGHVVHLDKWRCDTETWRGVMQMTIWARSAAKTYWTAWPTSRTWEAEHLQEANA